MKRLVLFLVFSFFVLGFLPIRQVKAQTSQNIIMSCLDATQFEPSTQTINGVSYNHLVSLKNKDIGIFSPNQPVYIVRSLPKAMCVPGSDPECVKKEPDELTFCRQETVGSSSCNLTCPAGGPDCTPNNGGPGVTLCCMPSYTKQGPYFECAKDKNGQTVCPQSIMAEEGQTNGIHEAENGHIETSGLSDFTLVNFDKSGLLADADGNIFIDAAQSMTIGGLEHSFYAMQIVSDSAIINNDAYRNSLKLALFAQVEEIEPSATNCTTVYWDPYGKIIDSLRLEPLGNINILLKNRNINNQIVKTILLNNPTFRNPGLTDLSGNFNFAVSPGTYFLEPSHSDFSFPISQDNLSRVTSQLAAFDPGQKYIQRNNLYNNSLEPIVEKEGFSQRRDIIMEPKDSSYQGSEISILYAENLRDDGNQLIRGRSSHPNSLIKVVINNTEVGSTQTDLEGSFSLVISKSVINNNPGFLQIFAEKTPIVNGPLTKETYPFLNFFIKSVLAQPSNTSKPYSLSLVPGRMSGFVFDTNLQVKPNSVVQLTIPSLGNISYSQTKADEDGFINISDKNLPPVNFVMVVKDPEDPKQTYQLTIEDFKKTNTVYLNETKNNLYNNSAKITKPDSKLIAKVKAETPNRVSAKNLSFNQPTPQPISPTDNKNTEENKNSVLPLIFGLAIIIIAILGFFIIRKTQKQKQIYY